MGLEPSSHLSKPRLRKKRHLANKDTSRGKLKPRSPWPPPGFPPGIPCKTGSDNPEPSGRNKTLVLSTEKVLCISETEATRALGSTRQTRSRLRASRTQLLCPGLHVCETPLSSTKEMRNKRNSETREAWRRTPPLPQGRASVRRLRTRTLTGSHFHGSAASRGLGQVKVCHAPLTP